VPTDLDSRDDLDYLTYRWAPDEEHRTPIGSYGNGDVVIGRREQGNVGTPLGTSPDQGAFCELDFTIGADGVRQVTATGRDQAGLRADEICMLRAQSCVDGSYKDE